VRNICKIKGIKKEEYPELYEAIESVCKKFNMNSIRVRICPWGFYAGALMGWLVVTKNLLKTMDKDELETIVAHEVSHMFNYHHIIRLVVLMIFYAPLIHIYLAEKIFNSPPSALLALVAIIWLLIGLRCVIWVSANLETNADIQAIYKTQKPEAFKRALLKYEFKSMRTDKRPSRILKIFDSLRWVLGYFFGFTHPSTYERIGYIEQYEKNMKLISRE